MSHSTFKIIIVISICLISISNALADGKVPTFVSIGPQKYFVQQIGKEFVKVQIMVPPGASPAIYEPKPKQMAALSKTKVYFSIGVPFEKIWLKKIASINPNMMIVNTDHGIQKIPMKNHHRHSKNKREKGEHYPQGILDPHIWLSPPLVMMQARMILISLQNVDPIHRVAYEANYKAFILALIELDSELRNTFAGKNRLQFMVFHPAWGYFAHTYGLTQVPIEIEGKNPKPARLLKLIDHAKSHYIKVIFVQPQFSSKSAELVANGIAGQVAIVNPLAMNWSENLHEVANKFKAALR